MKNVLLTCCFLLAGASRAAAEPFPEDRPAPAPAAPTSVEILTSLINYAAIMDPAFAAGFNGVIDCARISGSIGLRVQGGLAVTCEKTVAHDTQREAAAISSAVLDGYNRAFGRNVRVDGGVLGFGTGRPAAGGMPSLNFTPISAEHARPAVSNVIYERDNPREC